MLDIKDIPSYSGMLTPGVLLVAAGMSPFEIHGKDNIAKHFIRNYWYHR